MSSLFFYSSVRGFVGVVLISVLVAALVVEVGTDGGTLAAHVLGSGCVVATSRLTDRAQEVLEQSRLTDRARDVDELGTSLLGESKWRFFSLDVPQIGLDQVFLRPYSTVFEMARRVFWNL